MFPEVVFSTEGPDKSRLSYTRPFEGSQCNQFSVILLRSYLRSTAAKSYLREGIKVWGKLEFRALNSKCD